MLLKRKREERKVKKIKMEYIEKDKSIIRQKQGKIRSRVEKKRVNKAIIQQILYVKKVEERMKRRSQSIDKVA